MIKLEQISKIYNNDGTSGIGIQNVSCEFNVGEFVAITGESGSGKSTLLNVISMIDSYEEGELFINGKSTIEFSKAEFENFRSNYVSFIFQEYNLIDSFSVLENVRLPLLAKGISKKEATKIALKAIEDVDLLRCKNQKTIKLSGGEKQRTVIARALVSDTPIIACDEPTGNLDSATAKSIISLLEKVASNKLILYVTHDYESIKHLATRHIVMKDSRLDSDVVYKKNTVAEHCEDKKKRKTKFSSIFRLGLKNILSTPKKSLLSFFISLCVSLSSVVILVAAYSIVGEASSNIVETTTIYNDSNTSLNRVGVYGKGYNDLSFDDVELKEKNIIDKGNVLTSINSYSISLEKAGEGWSNFNAYEVNVIDDSYKLLTGEQPSSSKEIALGVSKSRYKEFISDVYAIDYFKRNFTNFNIAKVSPASIKESLTLSPVGVYVVDDSLVSTNTDYSLLVTETGFKNIYSTVVKNYANNDLVNKNFDNAYIYQSKYEINGLIVDLKSDALDFISDVDYTKIYVNNRFEGCDLSISFRGANIVVSSSDIIYTNNTKGVTLYNPGLINSFIQSGEVNSIYLYNKNQTSSASQTYLKQGFVSECASTPQKVTNKISEEGYINLIETFGYSLLFFAAVLIICYLGSLILGIIYNNRKKDYAILSSLSYSKFSIRSINFVEILSFFILTSLLSYGAFTLVSKVTYSFIATQDVDTNIILLFSELSTMSTSYVFIIIYFIFILFFAFIVSSWIMNRFMKKTLVSNFRKGGELL